MIHLLTCRSRYYGRSRKRSILVFTTLVLVVLVVVMFLQRQKVLQREEVLLPNEVLQPQEVADIPCRGKSWVNLRPKNNFAYIMARFPYIDQRTIQTANYRNWDKSEHVSRLVSQIRCQPPHINLLVTVISHSIRFKRREAIRKSSKYSKNKVRTDGKYMCNFS